MNIDNSMLANVLIDDRHREVQQRRLISATEPSSFRLRLPQRVVARQRAAVLTARIPNS